MAVSVECHYPHVCIPYKIAMSDSLSCACSPIPSIMPCPPASTRSSWLALLLRDRDPRFIDLSNGLLMHLLVNCFLLFNAFDLLCHPLRKVFEMFCCMVQLSSLLHEKCQQLAPGVDLRNTCCAIPSCHLLHGCGHVVESIDVSVKDIDNCFEPPAWVFTHACNLNMGAVECVDDACTSIIYLADLHCLHCSSSLLARCCDASIVDTEPTHEAPTHWNMRHTTCTRHIPMNMYYL